MAFDLADWQRRNPPGEAAGLPVVRWEALGRATDGLSEAEQDRVWRAAERQWAEAVAARLGLTVTQHGRLVLVGPIGAAARRGLVALTRRADDLLQGFLGTQAAPVPCGLDVVFCLEDSDHYYRLLSGYQPDGEHTLSAGCVVRGACVFVLLGWTDRASAEATLSHEWVHLRLGGMDLPLWVEEGLAEVFAAQVSGRAPYTMDSLRSARSVLTPAALLSGRAFGDLTAQRQAYAFSAAWVERHLEDPARFQAFLSLTSSRDGGRAAAAEVFGADLDRLPLGQPPPPAPSDRRGVLRGLLVVLGPVLLLAALGISARQWRTHTGVERIRQQATGLAVDGMAACAVSVYTRAERCRPGAPCEDEIRLFAETCYAAADPSVRYCELVCQGTASEDCLGPHGGVPMCRELFAILSEHCGC